MKCMLNPQLVAGQPSYLQLLSVAHGKPSNSK